MNEQSSNGKTQANHSVLKAVRILDYFRRHPQGRLSDLADHAGLGPSTALRLILSLEKGGALVRHPETREYSVGPWLLEVAATAVRSHPFTVHVHQILGQLRDETGETASYWVVDSHERLCVDRVLSDHALSSTIHIGTRLPLHVGAAGRALVACLPDHERASILEALPEDSIDVDALKASLDDVRVEGFATSIGERERGLASVAVPVLLRNNRLGGALSLTAPATRFGATRRKSAVTSLKAAADRLQTYSALDR